MTVRYTINIHFAIFLITIVIIIVSWFLIEISKRQEKWISTTHIYQSSNDILFFNFKANGFKFTLKGGSTLFIHRWITDSKTVDKNEIDATTFSTIITTASTWSC